MKPHIIILIILSVSIILGLLIVPRIKKGKYRMEGGVTLDLNALSNAGLLKNTHTHIHTHTHKTKNIVFISQFKYEHFSA